MSREVNELITIVEKFADSGWELISEPARAWLDVYGEGGDPELTAQLIQAVEQADRECGSCGCEFDPLYKKFLAMSAAL